VVNYAQWKSREDFDAMVKNPEAKAHMKPVMGIVETDFHLYESPMVLYFHERINPDGTLHIGHAVQRWGKDVGVRATDGDVKATRLAGVLTLIIFDH
jgi:hypothetical protein